MIYTIENELLKVSVTTWGAQVCSVIRKCDGAEHIWQADKSVWGYHAPILFPYAGKLSENRTTAKGVTWENAPQHGFARTMEHRFVRQNEKVLDQKGGKLHGENLPNYKAHSRLIQSSFKLHMILTILLKLSGNV